MAGGLKAPPAQATHLGQAFESLREQPSLPHPSLTSECQHTVQPALLLGPPPQPPHPPFPHKEQSETLYVGQAWQTLCKFTSLRASGTEALPF